MKTHIKTLGTLTTLALLLAACGGGGGGTASPAPTTLAAVQITATNAQAVAAHATDTTQNTSTQGAATVITGVQVDLAGSDTPTNLLMADAVTSVAQLAARSLPLATGVAVNQTAPCSGGGSVSANGSVATSGALTAGDNVTVTASNCVETVNGATATINGSLSISITSGGVPANASTFHVVMALTASNFTVTAANVAGRLDGDMAIDLTKSSSTSASLVISGRSLATSANTASGTRSSTWTGYRQGITSNGSAVAATLDGTIQVTNSRLAINNTSYQIATQAPVQWLNGFAPTSGVVVVTGAGNSKLRITFTPTGVTLEVDAAGNGVYAAPTTTTVAALRAIL